MNRSPTFAASGLLVAALVVVPGGVWGCSSSAGLETADGGGADTSTSLDARTGDSTNADDSGGVDYSEPVLLYEFPWQAHSSYVGDIIADEHHLYFTVMTEVFRADKSANEDPLLIGRGVRMGGLDLLAVDETHVYFLSGTSIGKLEKSTGKLSEISFKGHEQPLMAMGADRDRLFLSSLGCGTLVSVSKQGGQPVAHTQEVNEGVGGHAVIAVGGGHVYCTGGGGGNTGGKIFRCAKDRGPIEEFVDEYRRAACSYEITAMTVVGDTMYYAGNFGIEGCGVMVLAKADINGNDGEVLAELVTGGDWPDGLFYDDKRNALYSLIDGMWPNMIFKYSIADGEVTTRAVGDADVPLAADEDYLYWTQFDKGIYKMRKF